MKKFLLNLAASAAVGYGTTYGATNSAKAAAGGAVATVLMNLIGLAQKPPTTKK